MSGRPVRDAHASDSNPIRRKSIMKNLSYRLAVLPAILLFVSLVACNATAVGQEEATADMTTEQRAAYAIGVNLARNLESDGLTLDLEYLVQGAQHVFDGRDLLLDDTAMQSAVQELQRMAGEARQAKAQAEADENSAKGRAFLAENRTKEGIVETESGLQYEVITEADGPKPGPTDRVTLHYHGTTLDGTVFDSSVDRGQPATFSVNQVIPGFSEALQLMSPGAKYKFWVPDTLGYGMNVRPGSKFGPNELLIFEIELIEIPG